MDDQQHALAGLLGRSRSRARSASSDRRRGADGLAVGGRPRARAEPARAVFGIPRTRAALAREVTRRERPVLGGLGLEPRCLRRHLAGDPLLDALDVSEPSFRTAAGVLAALRRRGRPVPPAALARAGAPGARAALVPVAIPLVARPALLVSRSERAPTRASSLRRARWRSASRPHGAHRGAVPPTGPWPRAPLGGPPPGGGPRRLRRAPDDRRSAGRLAHDREAHAAHGRPVPGGVARPGGEHVAAGPQPAPGEAAAIAKPCGARGELADDPPAQPHGARAASRAAG